MHENKLHHEQNLGESTWSKGCLPGSAKSSNASGLSPNTPSTSSTNVESNHNNKHNKAENKSALKIGISLF